MLFVKIVYVLRRLYCAYAVVLFYIEYVLYASLTYFITGPPIHSVGASIVLLVGICRRRLSFIVVYNTPRRRNVTHQGAARDGGPVVLRPVRGTRCF